MSPSITQAEVQDLFRSFAAPLAKFVSLGCRKEAAEELARNLWLAMIGGGSTEQDVWRAMSQSDNELFAALKNCYEEEMKPVISPQHLAALRQTLWHGSCRRGSQSRGTAALILRLPLVLRIDGDERPVNGITNGVQFGLQRVQKLVQPGCDDFVDRRIGQFAP